MTISNSEDALTAGLVHSYPDQDLAVIELDKVPGGLKAAAFADSSKVAVGQIVPAMGPPLGLSSSVTRGIVSATGRTLSVGRSGGGTGTTIADMVQTSEAIDPDNSGGALVDLDGQVVGIPTPAAHRPRARAHSGDRHRVRDPLVDGEDVRRPDVKSDGATDKAGVQPGDVVIRPGDTDITTITSLSEAPAAQKPGERTSVTFTRIGSQKKVDVTLGEQ